MRNDSITSAIVIALSALLAAAETFAIATTPTAPGALTTRRTVATFDGRLEAGATAYHPVLLERGREYRVRVEAVAPGADVDLQLFSPAGREIDRAIGHGIRPSVATVPSGNGRYQVDVTMARCPVQPCAYRLVVLAR
ncbi:hypothetical protein [Luteitalea sp. TBR-22]|uniref:hypothetical protein n=1 Tax=Luteitalea sp. TBR-22 TaxID=2802971 RepID=UPI001EF5878D|nr:hypothetical protein [Luteitalea sp. TBR-22]